MLAFSVPLFVFYFLSEPGFCSFGFLSKRQKDTDGVKASLRIQTWVCVASGRCRAEALASPLWRDVSAHRHLQAPSLWTLEEGLLRDARRA